MPPARIPRHRRPSRRRWILPTIAGIVALAVVAVACQAFQSDGGSNPAAGGGASAPAGETGGTGLTGTSGSTTAPTTAPSPSPTSDAQITITPGRGAKSARPDTGLAITVSNGTLTNVVAKSQSGGEADPGPVDGEMNPAKTEWHSTWSLRTATTYLVKATAVDTNGLSTTSTSHFTTLTPSDSFHTVIFQGYKKPYGAGMRSSCSSTRTSPTRPRSSVRWRSGRP